MSRPDPLPHWRFRMAGLIWLALCAAALMSAAQSSSIAHIGVDAATRTPLNLGAGVQAIPDPQARFRAADVLAGVHDADSLRVTRSPINLGYPRHRYWAVLELHNTSPRPIERLLVLWRGSTVKQRAYWQRIDQAGRPLGSLRESAAHDIVSRHAVMRLPLPASARLRVAVRFDADTALTLDYRLLTETTLASTDRVDYLFFGVLTGVISAVACYVFALFFALRERLYLSFAGFAVSNIVYQLHTEGYAYLLWPIEQRPLGNLVSTYAGALFSLLVAQFVRDYLQLSQTQPRVDRRVMLPLMLVTGLTFPLFLVKPWLGNSVAALSVIFSIFLVAGVVVRGSWRGQPVWSFVFGVLFFMGAGVVHLCRRIGILPDLQIIALGLQLGSALFTILFAIAVMERVRRSAEQYRASQLQYAAQLEQAVAERTAELQSAKDKAEQALDALQGTQKQLVAAEKMASLGQLVAGIAHEINTPIGIAVTAASHMQDQGRDFAQKADTGKMTRTDLAGWRKMVDEAARLVLSNLLRAHTLIGSFKQVAVDQSSEQRRRFELKSFLSEVEFALQPTYKRSANTLSIDCPEGIELDTYPGALFQIFTNLVNNSLLHAFSDGRSGVMRITARADAKQVFLLYADDGRGMPPEVAARAFDPFFTTRRGSGGSGLGLHLVYNLTTQLLGGEIELHSDPASGTEFEIRFPRQAPPSRT